MSPPTLEPFRVVFSDSAIVDLRDRLARTRWPDDETVSDWSQGVPLAYLREVCEYWRTSYDFDAALARLNSFAQFRAAIDGLAIHFVQVRSPHAGALPIVITHGWPGTYVEFLGVIDSLAHPDDPADAFHVVVPSLPGFGFSDKPIAPGWNLTRTAAAWDALMRSLGYYRYGAQGGDWGAMLTTAIARDFPDHVVGIHVNMPVVATTAYQLADLTDDERAGLARLDVHVKTGRGYAEQQRTRPQTIGVGLVDSPALQCAWILEKCYFWTDCDGHPENVFTKDQILDNISVYWFGATGASSARYYWENFRDGAEGGPTLENVTVPSGVSIFPKEIMTMSPRMAATRFEDLRWFNRLERGGHFAAWEQPAAFVNELRSFFRTVR